MAAPDDTTSRSPSGDPQPSEPLREDSDGRQPLRRRIADRWNGLGPAGKVGVIAIGGAVVVGGFLALSNTRTSLLDPERDNSDDIADREPDLWINGPYRYYGCDHMGCKKKVNPTITNHYCCGRCSHGRDCRLAAQRDYDGPGGFAHNYSETFLRPGVCCDCGEGREAHPWVFDFQIGQRRQVQDDL